MLSSSLKLKIDPLLDHRIWSSSRRNFPATTVKCSHNNSQERIEKIREMVRGKVEIWPSAYDTAWVAMVPAREYSGEKPQFPMCLEWIAENQNWDGSWGVESPSLLKHSLACTLACLLPLRKWNVASPKLLHRGVEFIRSNVSAATDNHQITPIGFDIIFHMMIQYADDLNLQLHLDQYFLDFIFRNRDMALKRSKHLEYVSEGLGRSIDWKKMVATHQRSNGSILNSPASTAAALIHHHDDKCLQYLNSLLSIYKTWVPNIHPADVYARLCLVDQLQGFGIDRFFHTEIDTVLQETFRLWQQKDDEIFGNASCHAMAFRLLRMHGYHVNPDELGAYVDQDTIYLGLNDAETLVQLYKASQVRLPQDNAIIDKLQRWSGNILDKRLQKKVEVKLKNYHGILDAVQHRRNLDLYDVDHLRILQTAYRCPTLYNEDIFQLSAQDLMTRQAQNQKELGMMERWLRDSRLDKIWGRNSISVPQFLSANNFIEAELCEARLAYAKTAALITYFDDFFDHQGSTHHLLFIMELINQWNEPSAISSYPSQQVEILYSALHATVIDIAQKAFSIQGRCIKPIIIHLWIELLTASMSEIESCNMESPPNFNEYMEFATKSIGCRLSILPAIHLMGETISEEMISSQECTELGHHVSTVIRLLNDRQTLEKERKERTTNSVTILMEGDGITEEEAVSRIQKIIQHHTKELLKMVVRKEGSVVPRRCKDIFWKTLKVGYYLYAFSDEFSSPQQMKEDMKLVLHDPVLELEEVPSTVS